VFEEKENSPLNQRMVQTKPQYAHKNLMPGLTLNPITWKIWRVPTNASRWQMGLNWAFKGMWMGEPY
jgi:hypothetical protein